MQKPTPHRIPYTQIQQNPWPVWPYAGPGGGGSSSQLLAIFTLDGNTHGSSGTFGVSDQISLVFDDLKTLAGITPDNQTVVNEFNLIGLTGDKCLVAYRSETEEWILIDVYPEKTRRFYFSLTADWPNGLDQTSTDAAIVAPDPTHSGGDTTWSSITLRDRFNKASNAKGTGGTIDSGVCQLNYKTGQFDIVNISHVCRRGRGLAYAGFSDTPSTFQVQSVVGFDGRAPAASPLTVHNELEIPTLSTGDPVEIRWNTIEGRYYALPSASKPSPIRHAVLAEDANVTGRAWVWAKPADRDDITSVITAIPGDKFKVYFWNDVIRSPKYAKAGYGFIYELNDKDQWEFVNGPCISGCQATGTIDTELPDGVVGSPYSHTVTGTSIDEGTIAVSGLPAGLTFDSASDEISGTPSAAGTTQVTITVTDDSGCVITKIIDLIVVGA